MKPAHPYRLLRLLALVLALHLGALAFILTAATPSANAVLPKPSPRACASEPESPARPGCNPAPTVSFRSLPSALWHLTSSSFGVPSASIRNPATAGSRVSSGPVSSVFSPAKQNGVPNLAPTLPAVAG